MAYIPYTLKVNGSVKCLSGYLCWLIVGYKLGKQTTFLATMYLYTCILNNESISKPNNACITNAMKTVPRSEYNNDYGNHVSYQSKTSKCMKNHRHSLLCSRQVHHKLRDREPSRISMRRVFQLLKCRKLRKRHKNMLKKSTPVSSVLYNIATNYNYWKLKYFNSDNSFYSSFFRVPHKISVTYNAQKQTLLLSGDIELNPGPLNPGPGVFIVTLTLH